MTSEHPQNTAPAWILRDVPETHSFGAWKEGRTTGYFNTDAAKAMPKRLAEPESAAGVRAGWVVALPIFGLLMISSLIGGGMSWGPITILGMLLSGVMGMICLLSDIVFSQQMRTQFRSEQAWFEANKGHIAPVSDRKYDLPAGWYDLARTINKRCNRAKVVPQIGIPVAKAQALLTEWLDTPQPTDFGFEASLSPIKDPAIQAAALEYSEALAKNDNYTTSVEKLLTEIDGMILIHQAKDLRGSTQGISK